MVSTQLEPQDLSTALRALRSLVETQLEMLDGILKFIESNGNDQSTTQKQLGERVKKRSWDDYWVFRRRFVTEITRVLGIPKPYATFLAKAMLDERHGETINDVYTFYQQYGI